MVANLGHIEAVRIRAGEVHIHDGPMGGMFSAVKVREGLGRNDYRDPEWFRHLRGTVAYEYTGEMPD